MDAKAIAPPKVAATLPPARVIPFAPKMTYRDITIEAFPTPHGDADHASYLVEWHGVRLYFTGDTDSADQLLAMKNLDYAFVSPWLIGKIAQQKGPDRRENGHLLPPQGRRQGPGAPGPDRSETGRHADSRGGGA